MFRKSKDRQQNIMWNSTLFYIASSGSVLFILWVLDYYYNQRKYQNNALNFFSNTAWPMIKESPNTAAYASAIIGPFVSSATSSFFSSWTTSRIRNHEIQQSHLFTDMNSAYTEGMEAMNGKDYYHASLLFQNAREHLLLLYQDHHSDKFKRQLEAAYYNEAKALYLLNKSDSALPLLDIILNELNPHNIDALNLRGIHYMKLTFCYFEERSDGNLLKNIERAKNDLVSSYRLCNNRNDTTIFIYYMQAIEAELLETNQNKGKGKGKEKDEVVNAALPTQKSTGHYQKIIDLISFPPTEAHLASDLLFILAVAFKQLNMLKEAISAFEAALYCTNNTPAFYRDQARILTCCAAAYEQLSHNLKYSLNQDETEEDVVEIESRLKEGGNKKLNSSGLLELGKNYHLQAIKLDEEIAELEQISNKEKAESKIHDAVPSKRCCIM